FGLFDLGLLFRGLFVFFSVPSTSPSGIDVYEPSVDGGGMFPYPGSTPTLPTGTYPALSPNELPPAPPPSGKIAYSSVPRRDTGTYPRASPGLSSSVDAVWSSILPYSPPPDIEL